MKEYDISQISYIHQLASQYHYKKLPKDVSDRSRFLYRKYIKYLGLSEEGSSDQVYTLSGVLISNGYNRIVVGDYGAYVEMRIDQILKDDLILESTQKTRLIRGYKYNCKYVYYKTSDYTTKVFLQLKTISYADYKPGMYYVSPGEIYTIKMEDDNHERSSS